MIAPSSPEFQRAALRAAARLAQLRHVHADRLESPGGELRGEAARLHRQHDVAAGADRVEAEYLRVLVLGLDQLPELARERRAPGVVERRGVVRGGAGGENAQGGVQVV